MQSRGAEETEPASLPLGPARLYPGLVGPDAQAALVDDLRAVIAAAPMVRPTTPGGRQMSVRTSAAGRLGWVSGRTGYGYAPAQPSGAPWPPIPPALLALWETVSGAARAPDSCLINWYGEGARMGLHQDRDEADFRWPVVSLSLGDEGLFRIGGTERGAPTASHWLRSGDVVVLGGAARLAWHGVDRIRFRSSSLLRAGGRINVTMRVAT